MQSGATSVTWELYLNCLRTDHISCKVIVAYSAAMDEATDCSLFQKHSEESYI